MSYTGRNILPCSFDSILTLFHLLVQARIRQPTIKYNVLDWSELSLVVQFPRTPDGAARNIAVLFPHCPPRNIVCAEFEKERKALVSLKHSRVEWIHHGTVLFVCFVVASSHWWISSSTLSCNFPTNVNPYPPDQQLYHHHRFLARTFHPSIQEFVSGVQGALDCTQQSSRRKV